MFFNLCSQNSLLGLAAMVQFPGPTPEGQNAIPRGRPWAVCISLDLVHIPVAVEQS